MDVNVTVDVSDWVEVQNPMTTDLNAIDFGTLRGRMPLR